MRLRSVYRIYRAVANSRGRLALLSTAAERNKECGYLGFRQEGDSGSPQSQRFALGNSPLERFGKNRAFLEREAQLLEFIFDQSPIVADQ